MNELKIRFRTLTPIWTGGATRSSDVVHETGILGSLRWWYEGIIRGLGGWAADPTEHKSELNADKYQVGRRQGLRDAALLEHAGLCLASQLFGATGWQRRFRLTMEGLQPHPLYFAATDGVYVAAGNWLWRMFGGEETGGTKRGRGPAMEFTFGAKTLWGQDAMLRFMALEDDLDATYARLAFLLDVATKYGGIGAKTQHGFGQIALLDLDAQLVSEGCRLIRKDAQATQKKSERDAFRLDHFFSQLYRVNVSNEYIRHLKPIGQPTQHYGRDYIPCAFDIRYKSRMRNPFTGEGQNYGLRPWFREQWTPESVHQLFGRSNARNDSERSAGRIRVSDLYRTEPQGAWHLKVWGAVPQGLRTAENEALEISTALKTVVADIDAFISGVDGMFPGSQVIQRYDQQEVLGHE